MLTPQQCRAARAWLGWTQVELAAKAGVGVSTVADFERGQRVLIRSNCRAIETAFVDAGICVFENGLTGPIIRA